jgi:hypothetical protein
MEEKANTGNENGWKFHFPTNFGDYFVLLLGKITADNQVITFEPNFWCRACSLY